MAVQKAALHHLRNHALVETGAVQVGCLFGLQELGHKCGRRHHEAKTQTGCQHFGERAEVNAAVRVARGERQRRWCVKPQIAIRVVFNNR